MFFNRLLALSADLLKELEQMKSKISKDLLLQLIQELYFQTSWELIKELTEKENIDPNILFRQQLAISERTGVQGANSLKPFQFTGSPIEQIMKQFAFAAMNMGIRPIIDFKNDSEAEITFKKNCGHGLKIRQYKLPFKCSDWCSVHFNAEINALNPEFGIKLIEGLPEKKSSCKFLIFKKKA